MLETKRTKSAVNMQIYMNIGRLPDDCHYTFGQRVHRRRRGWATLH